MRAESRDARRRGKRVHHWLKAGLVKERGDWQAWNTFGFSFMKSKRKKKSQEAPDTRRKWERNLSGLSWNSVRKKERMGAHHHTAALKAKERNPTAKDGRSFSRYEDVTAEYAGGRGFLGRG